jgi:ectoine hydroxylase-related dioxygenase (phytanoyl-CoA dioxygenase family)
MLSQAHAGVGDGEAEYWSAELLERGYCVVPDIVAPARVKSLHGDLKSRFERTPFCQGDFYGNRTKRFGALLRHSPHAEAFVCHALVLAIAERILGPHCDRIQLNLTQALEIHPGQLTQPPHRDEDMWRGAKGGMEYLINVMWPFTAYTKDNGATVVWPNSHRWAPDTVPDPDAAVNVEMDPGAALMFLGSTLHAAGTNRTQAPRAGMIVSYCLGWLKPYENQWLVYPPHVARTFSPEVSGLAGYRLHRPNLGNYEGQCPSVLLRDEVPEYLPAIDEVRPDQVEPLAAFRAQQALERV